MHHDSTTQPSAVPIRSGIVMLTGYGIKVSVDRRHLAVSDGIGRQRRTGRFTKRRAGSGGSSFSRRPAT